MSDLVKRLRGAYSTVFERSLAKESADEIERLQAENAKLQRDGYSKVIDLLRKHAEAMADAKHVYDWETHAALYRADFPKEPDK